MVGKAARVFGVIFILVGILGFVPAVMTEGRLLGLFPVSPLHNAAHILLGVWGVAVATSPSNAMMYFKLIALIYAVLAVIGFFRPEITVAGMLLPLGGKDIALHLVLALIAAYFGFMARPRMPAAA
ncbi:MAG TPA: DUF4383 domain-containing protein [Gemmatimonadales bacterium]|jgi:hypothetical protein|nr:DUF4383 domain-containing protein [Gemmatimonadales bacterium]